MPQGSACEGDGAASAVIMTVRKGIDLFATVVFSVFVV
jgi:hypothetical protein